MNLEAYQKGERFGRFFRLAIDLSMVLWFFIAWAYGDTTSMIATSAILIYSEAMTAKHNSAIAALWAEGARSKAHDIEKRIIYWQRIQQFRNALSDPRYDFGVPTEAPNVTSEQAPRR